MGNMTAAGLQQAGTWGGDTHWGWVLSASEQESPAAAAALEKLCARYWYPLYAYVRRKGYDANDAQDLTQEFFARMLETDMLAQADPRRGKFRCFLMASMNHFLANQWRRAHAAKRHPHALFSIDDSAEKQFGREPATDLTPEKLYERRWALNLFEHALVMLRQQYEKAGKLDVFEVLKPFLSTEPGAGDYSRIGQQLGVTQTAVASAVHRLRQRYRELVRGEIAHTVATTEQFEEEIRSLIHAME